jgi:hypothetical protein
VSDVRSQGGGLQRHPDSGGNFNSHGFDVVSIYALTKPDAPSEAGFLIVPMWEGNEERLELTSSEGADCKLTGFRFIGGAGRDLQIVVAQREPGESYADAAGVTFTYFTLKRNSLAEPGWPLYYFESTRSASAKKPYCDADEAFAQELGFS